MHVSLISISAQNVDYGMTVTIGPFSQDNLRACVTIQITDDGIAENVESFLAMLVVGVSAPPLLVIDPANTTVNILDNDGEQVQVTVMMMSYLHHPLIQGMHVIEETIIQYPILLHMQ